MNRRTIEESELITKELTTEKSKQYPFKFMSVYDKERAKDFQKKVDTDPVITKKGKTIHLKDFINEGFESADLLTNIKRFNSIAPIAKESAFLMLDDMLLEGDSRDLLDIQIKGKNAFLNLPAETRRNYSASEFLKEYDNYKKLKENEKLMEIKNNTNNKNKESDNVEITSK